MQKNNGFDIVLSKKLDIASKADRMPGFQGRKKIC